MAYQREVWTNERKTGESWFKKNSLRPRSFISLLQEGHPSLAVDGNEDNTLSKCAVLDNYYTERPTLVINLDKLVNVGGLVIKTWQGKGQGIIHQDFFLSETFLDWNNARKDRWNFIQGEFHPFKSHQVS